MEKIGFSKISKALDLDINFDIDINSVSTDTRVINKGSLFIALKGYNFDGADYIEEAFLKGASVCITEKDVSSDNGIVIVVEDAVLALQKIASIYRQQFDINVIGITGSIGKTSTKEMVYAVLSGFEKTLKTKSNLNNEIGTPQTVLRIENQHKNAVIEMGMSNFFEIDALSKCILPDIGIITNIGVSHIENLKSQEGIFKAKSEIVSGLKESGILILNGDDDILFNNKNVFRHKKLLYGIDNKNVDAFATNIVYGNDKTSFIINYEGSKYNAIIPCLGKHNVLNSLAAFLVSAYLGYNREQSCENFCNFKNTGMRQNIVKRNDLTIIEDCYNAGPDSMRSALETLKILNNKGKKIAVLGDMLELGENSRYYHQLVGEYIGLYNIDILITFGEMSLNMHDKNDVKLKRHFYDKDDIVLFLKDVIKFDDALLFKASRGLKFEDIINKFYNLLI
ncbi:MAG: UDP-N-acetylmuramoyl-tripeptide--D-alanyl-D-alanine ligase [Oscillospiraceae bacterium]